MKKAAIKKQQGYIIVHSIIVMSAVVMAIVISATWILIGLGKSSSSFRDSKQARFLADSCAEIVLQEIRDDVSFNGSGSENFSWGDCSYLVTNAADDDITIEAEATVSGHVSKIEIFVDQTDPQINIAYWTEQ